MKPELELLIRKILNDYADTSESFHLISQDEAVRLIGAVVRDSLPPEAGYAPDFNDGGDGEYRNRREAIERETRCAFNDCRRQMLEDWKQEGV